LASCVILEVAANGSFDGRKEKRLADLCEKSKSLELVPHRVLEFGEAQLYAGVVQRFVQFGKHIGCGHSDVGGRLRTAGQGRRQKGKPP
jgi:hypothetical protein